MKIRKKQKNNHKPAVVSLTLLAIFLGALLVNDALVRSQNPQYLVSDNTSSSDIQKLNRAIANAQPMNPFHDLEWEKKVAEKLAQDKIEDRTPASVGRAVASIDEFKFGTLKGKYHVIDETSDRATRIKEINFIDSADVRERPIHYDPDKFLKDFGALLAIDFSFFRPAPSNSNQMNQRDYQLMNDSQEVVGQAAFVLDEEGRILSLKIRSASAE